MFYPFVKWRARRKYQYKELFDAAVADLQADLAADRAREKHKLAQQLNDEADAIDASIKRDEATPEYQALQGKELYEACPLVTGFIDIFLRYGLV